MTDERDEILEGDDELYEHHRIVVDRGQSPLRVDRFLMDRLPNATRTKLQAGIESESVRVNDGPTKASYKIRPLDVITVALPHPPRDTDIKPENILLQDGHALVADFGIALAVQSAGGQRMTQTGLSLGTPQYMSPEQAMEERVIYARSDIYALGAVTYEMLAGDAPFTGSMCMPSWRRC